MLKEMIVQEIQDLKAAGRSLKEVHDHFAGRPGKTPSMPTIRKYHGMDGVPEDLHARTAKPRAFDVEPFHATIVEILDRNPGCTASSACDVLLERYVDSGEYDILPGNGQTLRNYVRHLRESGEVATKEERHRTYDHVDDPPAGRQMQLDFGQIRCEGGLTVHFLCCLLRMSRYLGVYAQDHRFTSEEACVAIYRFTSKIGGRVEELVIDQDCVFVSSEEYGEVTATEVFGEFVREQDMRLWVCNKHDPESKGAVENSVKYVKSSFFSARNFTDIAQVRDALPGWCERSNSRIHQATLRVPAHVLESEERPALRPLLPSVHEVAPTNLIRAKVGAMPYIQYKASKYSVPRDMCFTDAFYKRMGDKPHVYDKDRAHVCTHQHDPVRGSYNRLEEHGKQPASDWMDVAERLRKRWNCQEFEHLVNGFKKENPRHLAQQPVQVERFLEAESPDRALVIEAVNHCCREYRYRLGHLKAIYEPRKAEWEARGGGLGAYEDGAPEVEARGMDTYRKAFRERCGAS